MRHTDKLNGVIDLKNIFRDYKGKWVAIEGKNNVIASGNNPVSVRKEALQSDHKNASLLYIPKRTGHFTGTTI